MRKRDAGGGLVDVNFTTTDVGGKTVATLTFSGAFTTGSGSLVDGNYELRIEAAKVHNSAGTLDGDKDGIPGDDHLFGNVAVDDFFRLFGDTDGNEFVDPTDFFDRFLPAFGSASGQPSYRSEVDADGNGFIDPGDFFDEFLPNFGTSRDTSGFLPWDFGDAPDTSAGSSAGNYRTLSSDNGPRHVIVPELFMGAAVDFEPEGVPNQSASGDDVDQALPDDEDGLNHPAADLTLTIGAAPTVNVIVTNVTGSNAMLSGWIDYNGDGVFDNAAERAQTVVSSGTGGIATLVFPIVPEGFTGTTYARFRLSTDAAASEPTGSASDGEVEDYVVSIATPAFGIASGMVKIASDVDGGPTLSDVDFFGRGASSLGDLDRDGITDLAVGAPWDDTGGPNRGAVYVLFMNADGTVRNSQKIAHETGGGPALKNGDEFGWSASALGDLDGDGITELAVGARFDDTTRGNAGAVYVLFMNADGTVKNSQKTVQDDTGEFGWSIAPLGDLDADGVIDVVVGARRDDTGGNDRGAVYVFVHERRWYGQEHAEDRARDKRWAHVGGPRLVRLCSHFPGRSGPGRGDRHRGRCPVGSIWPECSRRHLRDAAELRWLG